MIVVMRLALQAMADMSLGIASWFSCCSECDCTHALGHHLLEKMDGDAHTPASDPAEMIAPSDLHRLAGIKPN